MSEGLEDAVTDFFDGGPADSYTETASATQASDIAGVIGTASVTDEDGNVTTAATGLIDLLEQAEALGGDVTTAEGELETAELSMSAWEDATTIEFGEEVINPVSFSFDVNTVTSIRLPQPRWLDLGRLRRPC